MAVEFSSLILILRVLITDIGGNNEEALICRSEKTVSGISGVGDWYLHPTRLSINPGDRIVSPPPDRGWSRNRDVDSEGHRLVRLRRSSDTAEEGVLTCNIPGDNNTPGSVVIYYPSEP